MRRMKRDFKEKVLDVHGEEIPDVEKQQVAAEKQELERKFSCLSEEVRHGLWHGLVSWEWVTARPSSGPLLGEVAMEGGEIMMSPLVSDIDGVSSRCHDPPLL